MKKKFFTLPINFLNSSFEERYVVSYAQLIHNKDIIRKGFAKINQSGMFFSKENMLEIISNLLRQSSFQYVSNGSLTDEYFDLAYSTLNEGFLYIIITNFGSAASRLLSIFKNKSFNHVLLSFDKKLYTIISYNGGACKNTDSSIMVYRLKATSEEKKKVIEKLHEFNKQGNENMMLCSKFVYKILALANLIYFQKDIAKIRPTDFVELDYYRKLEFAYEIKFCKKSSDLEYKT